MSRLISLGGIVFLKYEIGAGSFQKDFYKVSAVRIVIDDQNPSFRLAAVRPMGSSGGELAAEVSGKKSAAINFCMIHERTLIAGRHALSQVTNHAPIRPRSTPSSGLDTANQNGIISLKEIVSRVTFAV